VAAKQEKFRLQILSNDNKKSEEGGNKRFGTEMIGILSESLAASQAEGMKNGVYYGAAAAAAHCHRRAIILQEFFASFFCCHNFPL
jgi:hypothetical protein